jgi:hypothetical protein
MRLVVFPLKNKSTYFLFNLFQGVTVQSNLLFAAPQLYNTTHAFGYPAHQYNIPQYPASWQYPALQSLDPRQYPAPQYPAAQYPAAQYPAAQYPASQYPAAQYPASQYPAAQYPARQFDVPTKNASRFVLNNPKLDISLRPAYPRQAASPIPATDFAWNVDYEKYAQLAFRFPIAITSAILAPRNATSPNAAAALAYMKAIGSNEMCSRATEAYMSKILSGGSVDEANADATAQYISDYNSGLRSEPGTACEYSDIAWRKAEAEGKDPVVASAVAFMEHWPGLKEGNPCAVSGVDYVNAIIQGSTHLEANRMAAKSFGEALKKLAAQGNDLKDPACAAATRAFYDAVPEKPSPPNAAAMLAFIDKAFTSFSFEYDPVCWKATEAFFKSYADGKDELSSNLFAAEVFLDEFAKAGLAIPADSPCAAATRAYYQNIPNPPSPPNKAAMEAFMDAMIAGGKREPDPVCAASTKAYW